MANWRNVNNVPDATLDGHRVWRGGDSRPQQWASDGHYLTGPGPAGPGGGVAGAERATRAASLIPSRTSPQRRACAGDRGAVTLRSSGGESNAETGTRPAATAEVLRAPT